MARPTKRRQIEAATSVQSISAFVRLQKVPTSSCDYAIQQKTIAATAAEPPATTRKRKASVVEEDDAVVQPLLTSFTNRTVSFPPSSSDEEEEKTITPAKRACRRREPETLLKLKQRSEDDRGKRVAKTVALRRKEKAHRPVEDTVIAKSRQNGKRTIQTKVNDMLRRVTGNNDRKEATTPASLPAHLLDLVALHQAFLKTTRVQFAHSGNNVPLDIQALAPHISRMWGKRQATIDDIRRCIAIQTCSSGELGGVASPFFISDYGRGKVCIELRTDQDAVFIDEDKLCSQFERNLRALCVDKAAADSMADVDACLDGLSLADLPQAEISPVNTGIAAHPAIAKGQRVLSALRNDSAAREVEKEAARQAAATLDSNKATALLNPDGSRMSLLDRLRAKQLAKAGELSAPTGPELQRRAALSRVMDVAATISMLSLSTPASLPRQAFTMSAILQKLKDSLRVPLSREEGAACVKLIAGEVAPEWLKIVNIGGRENVVLQRGAQPVERVILQRVQQLSG